MNSETTFSAYRIRKEGGQVRAGFERISLDDLTPGEVVIRAAYSGVNYKDALAATGKGNILKRFPLVGGIDVAGVVESSASSRFGKGDAVLVCGCGLSETRDGGYAEYARVPAECAVKLPEGLNLFQAMAIGTAGLTAALALQRMEQNGQTPAQGPILVSGAGGGVGSLCIDLFSGLGYEVVALTSKKEHKAYLEELGAARVLVISELILGISPLEKGLWAGAVDTLGGEVLSWMIRSVKPFGNVASIGLAVDSELRTSVMPFILRGVSLLGINSTLCPAGLRDRIWARLATDMKPRRLEKIAGRLVDFAELPSVLEAFLHRKTVGRMVVRIGGQE